MNYINHSWINANTIENRKYQTDIAKHALDGNLLAVMPTGIGKTPIAALVAAYRLEKYPDGKILMMAPTRPLVEQHCKSFQKFIKFGPSEQVVITGTISQSSSGQSASPFGTRLGTGGGFGGGGSALRPGGGGNTGSRRQN